MPEWLESRRFLRLRSSLEGALFDVKVFVDDGMAALLYTPVLAFFVWDFAWWLAILVTPSAFVTGMAGLVLALPLLIVVERVFPTNGDN